MSENISTFRLVNVFNLALLKELQFPESFVLKNSRPLVAWVKLNRQDGMFKCYCPIQRQHIYLISTRSSRETHYCYGYSLTEKALAFVSIMT